MKFYNLELEQSIIGSLLIDPDILPDIRARLPLESFYSPPERYAYGTIAGMADKRLQIDFLTVADELEKSHPGHDWLPHLANLARNVPSTVNALTYADAVRQYAYLRQVYQAGEEVCRSAAIPGDLTAKVAAAQKAVESVLSLDVTRGPVDPKTAIQGWMDHLNYVHESSGMSGITTGFTELDDLTSGMKPGELHILAARPGQGKTVLALQIGLHAVKQGLSVLFFSLEMQTRELIARLASCYSGTYYRNLQTADLDVHQWQSVNDFMVFMSAKPFYIDDRPSLSIDEIRAVARSHKNRIGVDLVIIDYLQLAQGDGDSDVMRVGNVSRGCKMLAKELDCPVVALSQFNRGVEQRADGRPKLSDLRSSGQIEQDADVVAMLHKIDDDTTELIVEKNRHGKTGSVWLKPEFYRMRFVPGYQKAPEPEYAPYKKKRLDF